MVRHCILLICLSAVIVLNGQANDDIVHAVGAGETLTSIANAYGVTLNRLLTLNGLDPDAYLQIGQRLLVIPAGEITGSVDAGATRDEAAVVDSSDAENAVPRSSADAPAAPVAAADAPMLNPADISPRLCFALFEDDNQNGLREPGERYLKAGTILLLDAAGSEVLTYATDGESEPFCLQDLARSIYRLEGGPPVGYGLTSSAVLQIDLSAGGKVNVEFGAKSGLEAFIMPTAELVAADLPAESAGESSLLRELSGIFVLAVAGAVLISGMLVSLLLRGR